MISRKAIALLFCLSNRFFVIFARKDGRLPPRGEHQSERSSGREDADSSSPSPPSVRIRTASDAPFRLFKYRNVVARKNLASNDHTSLRQHIIGIDDDSPAPSSSVPCPPAFDPQRVDYVAGDTVEIKKTKFVCRSGPHERYCNVATLKQAEQMIQYDERGRKDQGEEDGQLLWLGAWKEVGDCAPITEENKSDRLEFTNAPTLYPTTVLSDKPSQLASIHPSISPSVFPSIPPTRRPFMAPTSSNKVPSKLPSTLPTSPPVRFPTWHPTYFPTTNYPTFLPSSFPTASPTDHPTLSPTTSTPTSSPLAVSPTAYADDTHQFPPFKGDFTPSHCSPNSQVHVRVELVTDNYPTDTSWQFIDRTNNVIMLSSPLDGYRGDELGDNKMESQTAIRDVCLNMTATTTTKYEFVIKDSFGDGLCCRVGIVPGHYKLLQYAKKGDGDEWKVLVAGSNFKSKEVHYHFELQQHDDRISSTPDIQQSIVDLQLGDDTSNTTTISTLKLSCPPPQRKITIQILTDDFGNDTSWEFRNINNGNRGPILAKNERTYGNRELDTRDVCVEDSSLYELTVKDTYGDGMCCRYEAGHYKILRHRQPSQGDGGIQKQETLLYGGFFMAKQIRHLVNTTLPTTTDRDLEWLESHNTRREYWHAYYNTTYVPLLWSESLKAEAKVWADTLLDSCETGMHHDPKRRYGENAAGNTGSGSWAKRRKPELIVARFVDREVDLEWPSNGHLVQALWRASKYVGCAESHKFMGAKKQCHTQVCRYARTGNCNLSAFKNEDGDVDWKTPMLEDANFCGPICPTDGCQA